MTTIVLLQKFKDGQEVAIPFQPVVEFLNKFGKVGKGEGDHELTFSDPQIALVATINGTPEKGVLCISVERPNASNPFRNFAFQLMHRFGLGFYDSALDFIYFLHGTAGDFPAEFNKASATGIAKIAHPQQIWPDLLFIPKPDKLLPALRYTNPNPTGTNLVMLDGEVTTSDLLCTIVLHRVASRSGLRRALFNLLFRLDAALRQNANFRIICEAPRDMVAGVTELGQLFYSGKSKRLLVREMDPERRTVFGTGEKITQMMEAFANDMVKIGSARFDMQLDWSDKSILDVEQILEKMHLARKNLGQSLQLSESVLNTVRAAGAYIGEVHRRQYGGKWGHFMLAELKFPCIRSTSGVHFWPWLQVMNSIEVGDQSAISSYYHSILSRDDTQGGRRTPDLVAQPGIPANPEMENAIHELRSNFLLRKKQLNERTYQSLRVSNPPWMEARDPLAIIEQQQLFLHQHGEIVWAALAQANNQLFRAGDLDSPALLVFSKDPYFDARPAELRQIGHRLFALKHTAPLDPDAARFATMITDELDRGMDWKVPLALTARDVRCSNFMVFRQHLPSNVLSFTWFPILVHPSTPAVMMVPFEFWPFSLTIMWKEKKLQDT